MLTNKLLAALGIAGALLVGATPDASANPWRGPGFRAPVVYRAPIYRRPVFVPRPVVYSVPVVAPAYAPTYAPTYAPVYQPPVVVGPVYSAPVYRPVYGGVGWRHPWVRHYGRRW